MEKKEILRKIPSVDKILARFANREELQIYGLSRLTEATRETLKNFRAEINDESIGSAPTTDEVAKRAIALIEGQNQNSFKPIVNLTGTILHTNLGRATLPDVVANQLSQIASGNNNLEYELESGSRGDRDTHVEKILMELTGAEAATIVNNNAAAVLLCLNTFASKKEVCVSRGELVEIGGSFRIPDVMEKSGSVLREVGTTNRTHLEDYAAAVHEQTGLIMKTHTSNYVIKGFTHEASHSELANLAKSTGIPLFADLGSGTLLDLEKFGLDHETTVQELIAAGTDLVSFSGDKLLGGPQAGIIVGRRALIAQLKKNPLKRALRVDKLTISALSGVLNLYRHPETLRESLPTLRFLTKKPDEILEMAQAILPDLLKKIEPEFEAKIVETKSQIGSGALPLDQLDSFALCIESADKSDKALREIARRFRTLQVPIIGRITGGRLLFDLRTLELPSSFLDPIAELKTV
ncbi:MAG: L-seryl-tRNA(Sec) selenium transferase [Pseudomonadota bacterium]|nr:L-seryl-tRNA(Sec) selenium transferase [Pseudomonadota bacterium]